MKINILRQLGCQLLPGLAKVAGSVKIRPHVIHSMRIDHDISRGWVEMGRFDAVDGRPSRYPRNVLRDIAPILAAVLRNVDQSIVAADPEDAFLFRRFRNGED